VKYQQIVRTISETAWAILPSKLAEIREFVAARADGAEFTEEEIKAAIGGRPASKEATTAGTVAIIPLYGVLTPRADLMSQISGATSLERFAAVFEAAVAHPDIDAIVLDVDSPGGSCDMVTETAAIIREARGAKPIIAVANTAAGSAAYWLASQADEMIVSPSGRVGSVGVLAAHTDISGAQEKAGVKTTLVSAGKYKTELSPFEPLSDEARASLQDTIDKMYALFVADVAAGRGVSEAAVRDGFGQGRMLPATDAVAEGMADSIATLDDTVDRLLTESATANQGFGGARSIAVEIHGNASKLQRELLRAGLAEPDRELPPGYTGNKTNLKAANSGLSFADEAAAARDVVAALVDRTRSLAEVRRGRLTTAKREQLAAIYDSLFESFAAIGEVLAQTDPHRHPNLDDVKANVERVGAGIL
jgi:signal peptide peptidase SppA